jgi:lipoprotein signal peptidase
MLPHVNHGALFGLGNDHESQDNSDRANTVFAVVSLIAAIAIVAWTSRRHNLADRWLCIALGLILGGTLGNLYDRIVFGGVRDFLYFYKIEWPVFNLADCGLVVGAAMLVTQALLFPGKKEVNAPTTAVAN